MSAITRLYPTRESRSLNGAYLAHSLRECQRSGGRPFVYANFVTSLDGRIAIPHPSGEGLMVPKQTANDRDWRLFQELAAQADLIISSGRYLRDWAEGRAQEILRVDDPAFADLRQWRLHQGLPPQPDLAVISGSLDFPIPEILTADGRRVIVFTSANPPPERVAEIKAKAGEVFVVGEQQVDGAQMVQKMGALGYKTVYSGAGPKILHLLLSAKALDRLYLTYANRILGGNPFSSIVEGPLFEQAVDLQLDTLYLDPEGVDGLGQLFASYSINQ